MPKGYRYVILTAFGFLILGNAQTDKASQDGKAAPQQGGTLPTLRQQIPAKPYQPSCDKPADSNEATLCASISQAHSAIDQASTARTANELNSGLLYLNIAGLILIGLTLIATAWAAWSASRATKVAIDAAKDPDAALAIAERNANAASEANEVSRAAAASSQESERRQTRAYLFLDAASLIYLDSDPTLAHYGKALCEVSLRNSGRTPAYTVHHVGDVKILPFSRENELVIPALGILPMNAVPQGGFLFKTVGTLNSLTDEEIAGIRHGVFGIFLFGRITYRDAFNAIRFTDYRLYWTGSWPPLPGTKMNFSSEGNNSD